MSKTFQAQISFDDQSTKVKLLVLKLRHFCILHGSEVTLFCEMPITRVRSNVIGVARLSAKYVNTASEVKFHVQWGTDERKKKAPLWKPVEAKKKKRFKICSTTNDLAKGLFSRSVQKPWSKLNQNKLENAFCIGLFAIQNDCVARSSRFSVPLMNPDNN